MLVLRGGSLFDGTGAGPVASVTIVRFHVVVPPSGRRRAPSRSKCPPIAVQGSTRFFGRPVKGLTPARHGSSRYLVPKAGRRPSKPAVY